MTEAACLLRTGALYDRRIGLDDRAGHLVFAGIKRGVFSLYQDDEPIYHVDLEGRWQRAFVAGVHYRKALDGSIDAIDRPREAGQMVLRRRGLSFAEATDLDATIRAAALDLIDGLGSGRFDLIPPPEPVEPLAVDDLRELLERIARWDAAAWFADRERHLATYGPLPFLPPESHQSVILQATLGHARGVAFGGSGPAEPYARSPEEFAAHAREVATLWGRRLLQANAAFLAGADALRQPIGAVAAYLDAIASRLPIQPAAGPRRPRDLPRDEPRLDGIDAFLDEYSAPLPSAGDWADLAARHLRRMTLGVESGSAAIRHAYGRDWKKEDLRAAVADLKAAALGVRVVALVGAGGTEGQEEHVAATADLLGSLPLGRGDLVYLVDAAELSDAPPGAPRPLAGEVLDRQRAALKERLEPLRRERGVKLAPYSPEKQWN